MKFDVRVIFVTPVPAWISSPSTLNVPPILVRPSPNREIFKSPSEFLISLPPTSISPANTVLTSVTIVMLVTPPATRISLPSTWISPENLVDGLEPETITILSDPVSSWITFPSILRTPPSLVEEFLIDVTPTVAPIAMLSPRANAVISVEFELHKLNTSFLTSKVSPSIATSLANSVNVLPVIVIFSKPLTSLTDAVETPKGPRKRSPRTECLYEWIVDIPKVDPIESDLILWVSISAVCTLVLKKLNLVLGVFAWILISPRSTPSFPSKFKSPGTRSWLFPGSYAKGSVWVSAWRDTSSNPPPLSDNIIG